MERVRRRGEEERARAEAVGMSHPMDKTRPWDWVWGEILSDSDFWRVELEEPAMLILMRGANKAPSSDNLAHPGAVRPNKRPVQDSYPSAPPPPAKIIKQNDVDGNSFKSNRKGKRLCEAFNQGTCPHDLASISCPKDRSQAHQCSRCLDTTHGAHACPRTDYPAQRVWDAGKGNGKGYGKGKHKGKRWQY